MSHGKDEILWFLLLISPMGIILLGVLFCMGIPFVLFPVMANNWKEYKEFCLGTLITACLWALDIGFWAGLIYLITIC
jgi:hypothetical protein